MAPRRNGRQLNPTFPKTLLLVALATAACGAEQPGQARESREDPNTAMSSDAAMVEQVRAVLDRYRGATDAADTAAIRSLYTSDGRFEWMEDGSVRYRSP